MLEIIGTDVSLEYVPTSQSTRDRRSHLLPCGWAGGTGIRTRVSTFFFHETDPGLVRSSDTKQGPSRWTRGFHNVFERSGFPVLDDKMCVTGLRILTLPQSAHTEPTARAHTTQGVLKTCRYAPFKTKEIQLGLRMGGGGKHFHRNGGFPGPPVVKGLLRPPRQQHSARWQSTHLFLVFTGLSRLY